MLQKELREVLGERQSRRGGFVQAIIIVAVMGVLYPLSTVSFWRSAHPLAIVYFAFFPGMLAVTVAADAFAGERERKTLETLLAMPIGEWAVLAGKAGAAVIWALAVTAVAFGCAVVTVNVAGHAPGLFLPAPVLVAGALLGALAASSLLTGIAILMSMRVAVARSAQQMTALLSLVVFGGIATSWVALGIPLEWPYVFAAEGLLAALAVIALTAARVSFRRDRFFDTR
ncbi:MAG: ABC transporter permease subunit [Polyangiaceae bacterium]